jgi:hypothetical protein
MRSLLFLFSIALGSAACSTVTILEAEGGGGGAGPVEDPVGTVVASTGQAATTDVTTGVGGHGGAEPSDNPQGMFDCDFTPACEQVFIYQGERSGGLRCTAELALSGKSGIVIESASEGGINPTTSEMLVLYAGDGIALVQERHSPCLGCAWEPNPATHVLRCPVVVSPEIAAACAFGTEGCAATPSETLSDDCVVEAIPQCATPAFVP